ncbi:HAD-IIIC family phosphatase [Thiothrix lacustris]|uniref:HAD-IIIC family phosphatase n=1 Tax=Thiothrix lacustris TaxID=525917 RepID=UPI000A54257B|nr:HAD-IIIC family phosphatase [Thiothrix lacustris]
MSSEMSSTIKRMEGQPVLFAARPTRLSLQQLNFGEDHYRAVTVNVWRNHALESIVSLANPYFAFGRWQVAFNFGDYDDSLMFAGHAPADIELLWLDSSRYLENTDFASWSEWLLTRLGVLRSTSTAPIIVATWLQNPEQRQQMQALVDTLPDIYFADIGSVCREAGVELLDMRIAVATGSPVSNAAQAVLARKLACHWLPAAISPPIKALALDLDNTLHKGILGEDGVQGVELTPQHIALQASIKALQQKGIFLALVSRNERVDVEELFAKRDDFPLKWDDFAATEVSWGDKASAIARVAQALRIAPDAVLFVDDNLGELVAVTSQLPTVHAIHAHDNAELTQRAMEYYPGLWRWKVTADDVKRNQDMKANALRESLLTEVTDPEEYLRNLQVSLTFNHSPQEYLSRLADLCKKTNQFNLAMRRFSLSEITERHQSDNSCVACVQLKDRLSDSGIIAVMVAERHGDLLVIEELCISCRALGRQLEDTLVLWTIRQMPQFQTCQQVAFRVQHGPRNQPAIAWLAEHLEMAPDAVQEGLNGIPKHKLEQFTPVQSVKLTEE